MFKGAFILATGFALGYGKAMQDSAEIKDLLTQVLEELKKQHAVKVETAEEADAPKVDVEADAVEVEEPTVVPPHPDKGATDDAPAA